MNLFLYRYESSPCLNGVSIYLETFPVVRETPQGYWYVYEAGEERWVSANAKRRYCYPTKQEAWESFLARRRRQESILLGKLESCQLILQAAAKEAPNDNFFRIEKRKINLSTEPF